MNKFIFIVIICFPSTILVCADNQKPTTKARKVIVVEKSDIDNNDIVNATMFSKFDCVFSTEMQQDGAIKHQSMLQ